MIKISLPRKVLVIGLDGETYRVITPLLTQGKLPNIKNLIDDGVAGTLKSTVPPVTAPAWSTFMTGKNPGKHGVYSFMKFAYAEGKAIPYESAKGYPVNGSAIRAKTIWEIMSDAGKRIISINIPMTYPPRKINGLMVSCFFTPPGAREYTYPESLMNELEDYEIDVDFGDGFGQFGRLDIKSFDVQKVVPAFVRVLEKRERAALKLMQQHPWDFFSLCFTETDRLHHLLWKYADPCNPAYSTDIAARIREDYEIFYQRLDEAIGKLVDCAGKGIITLILSDHGFRAAPKQFCFLNQWLRQEGYLMLEGEDKPSPEFNLNSLMQWIRRRKTASTTNPGSIQQSPQGTRIDWRSSRAWAEPLLVGTVGIRINEPKAKGEGYEAVRRLLMQSLIKLKDPETGMPVIKEVKRREEIFTGKYTEEAPDIIVTLNSAYDFPLDMTVGIRGERLTTLIGDRLICGTHEEEGIYIFSGDPVRRNAGFYSTFSIADIAPTLLYLLDVPVPDDMDGRVLREILNGENDQCDPVRYQRMGPKDYQDTGGSDGYSDEEAEKIKERLKNWGYA